MTKLNNDLNNDRVAPCLPAGPAALCLLSAWPFPGQPQPVLTGQARAQ